MSSEEIKSSETPSESNSHKETDIKAKQCCSDSGCSCDDASSKSAAGCCGIENLASYINKEKVNEVVEKLGTLCNKGMENLKELHKEFDQIPNKKEKVKGLVDGIVKTIRGITDKVLKKK